MTDEEMAEDYAKGLCKTCTVDTCRYSTIQTCAIKESIKQAHLAGLKAGRPKWHKVADGDLPKVGVQVLSEQGTLVIYKGDGFYWVEYSPNADNIKLRKWEEPSAWCEIPKYTEE